MLQDKIDAFLIKKNAEKDKKGISPSNIGSCPRKLFFIDKNAPYLPFTPQQLRVFEAGNLVEQFAVLSLSPIVIEYQKTIEYRGIKGTLDVIINYNGKARLVDIKSVNSKKFQYLDKEGIDQHYIYQVAFYWLALKAADYPNLDETATVYYIEKDTLLTKEMSFKPIEAAELVNKRIDNIKDMQKNGKCPCEKTEINWECFSVSKKYKTVKIWCNYIKHCPGVLNEYSKAVQEMGLEYDQRLKETCKHCGKASNELTEGYCPVCYEAYQDAKLAHN